MKSTLLFVVAFLTSGVGRAQYSIPPGDITKGTYTDNTMTGWITTTVTGETWRRDPTGGVTYNHILPIFIVDGAWLTQFADGPTPDIFGTPGDNVDYFLAQGSNEISGDDGKIVFDDVYFNNGGGNTMNITNTNSGYWSNNQYGPIPGGIIVAKTLFFNNGITITRTDKPVKGAIVFVNSASYTGGLTDAQHVNGFVTEVNYKNSPQTPGHGGDFTFPVGNGSEVYQLRRQGLFVENDSTLTVGWVNLDPNIATTIDPTQGSNNLTIDLPASVVAIAQAGFWDWHYQNATVEEDADINGASAMKAAQNITVSIPDLSGYPGLLPGDLRLIGYDPINIEWKDLSGGPNAIGLTKGSLLSGTIPAGQLITAIAIGSTNAVILPVTFTAFTVTAEGCKALLEWQTGMEQNNSHFVVERSSNGAEFTAIAKVGAAGNSNTTHSYKYTDEAPANGVNYYRITQVDFDGKHSSTDIKAIRIQCNGNALAIKAYPNPAASQVNIQSGKAVAQVNVVATNGQTVMKYVPSQNQGGTFSLNIQQVQNGIYLLQIVNKDGTIDVIKLLKQ